MKRIFAIFLCISLLLSGCFGGNTDSEEMSHSGGVRENEHRQEGPQETVSGTPEHISGWSDPLEGIPEPTYYVIDEELAWAMSLIGMEPIPPEDTLDEEAPTIPMDGLWNTERTYQYDGTLTADNLQDFFAMYARDADLTALPPVMEPVAVSLESTVENSTVPQKNFIDYYNDQSTMVSIFEKLVEKNLDKYNEDKGLDDSVFLYLIAFDSWELAMGASFTEETSWEQLRQGIVMAFEMFGGTNVEVLRNEAHNYTVTYTNDDGETLTEHFRADAQNGIQMICYKDGVLSEFFEFIELGDNTYVWQSDTERMLMRYQDKTVLSCWYSALGEETPSYTEADLLYGTSNQPNDAWVMEREEFHTRISFNGTALDVTTVNFFIGGVGHAEISPVEQ